MGGSTRSFLLVIGCLVALIAVSYGSGDAAAELVLRGAQTGTRPAGRSLLFFEPDQEFELVAAINGTVYLVESNSRKILWSFSSGGPMYSSHHVPINHDDKEEHDAVASANSFVDCGDDWELYLDTHFSKLKLGCTIQDVVNQSPLIVEDGGIILGSRHATVLKVDPWTGRLIKNYGKSGNLNATRADAQTSSKDVATELQSPNSMDAKNYNVELCIKRIDYLLQSLASNSAEQWNLTVATFEAAVQCKSEKMFEAYLRLDRTSEGESKTMLPEATSIEVSASPSAKLSSVAVDPSSARGQFPPALPNHLDFSNNGIGQRLLTRRSLESKNSKLGAIRKSPLAGFKALATEYGPLMVLFIAVVLMGFGIYSIARPAGDQAQKSVHSRSRRSRRSGRSISSIEEGRAVNENRQWMSPGYLVNSGTDGHAIGKLFVTNTEIAKGSDGTVVFDVVYEGRTVAVKRLVLAHHNLALKEIQHLIASDQHPNIVRLYGVEYDKDFVSLSLERCTCSVNELIQLQTNSSHDIVFVAYQPTSSMAEHKERLNVLKPTMQDLSL